LGHLWLAALAFRRSKRAQVQLRSNDAFISGSHRVAPNGRGFTGLQRAFPPTRAEIDRNPLLRDPIVRRPCPM